MKYFMRKGIHHGPREKLGTRASRINAAIILPVTAAGLVVVWLSLLNMSINLTQNPLTYSGKQPLARSPTSQSVLNDASSDATIGLGQLKPDISTNPKTEPLQAANNQLDAAMSDSTAGPTTASNQATIPATFPQPAARSTAEAAMEQPDISPKTTNIPPLIPTPNIQETTPASTQPLATVDATPITVSGVQSPQPASVTTTETPPTTEAMSVQPASDAPTQITITPLDAASELTMPLPDQPK
ncbi:MAG TPA: hypothetical protein VF575_01025 [Candidatus Saccharimonadales bacterium]|jgi:hypothetical protein